MSLKVKLPWQRKSKNLPWQNDVKFAMSFKVKLPWQRKVKLDMEK